MIIEHFSDHYMQNLERLYLIIIDRAFCDQQMRKSARGVNRVRNIEHVSGKSVRASKCDVVLEWYRGTAACYYLFIT